MRKKNNTAHTQAELIPHPGYLDIIHRDELHVYRQGDCLFIPISEIDLPGEVQHGLLLRRGENNGRHAVKKDGETEVRRVGQQKYIRARKGATIVHGEHNEVRLPPGYYMMRVQREASLVERGGTRQVMD